MDSIGFHTLQAKLLQTQSLPLVIKSDSMEPVLKTGQSYQVDYKTYSELQVFDIVVFYQGTQLMAHFLWHFNTLENRWQTRCLRYPKIRDTPFCESHYLGIISKPAISRSRQFLFYAQALMSRSL